MPHNMNILTCIHTFTYIHTYVHIHMPHNYIYLHTYTYIQTYIHMKKIFKKVMSLCRSLLVFFLFKCIILCII